MSPSAGLIASTRTRRPLFLVGGGLVVAALLVVLLARGNSDNGNKVTSAGRKSSGLPAGEAAPGAGAAGTQSGAGGSGQGAAASQSGLHASLQPVDRSHGTPNMPLNVSVSNTKNLRDGDPVAIHVTAKDGSQIFGFEAFLCSGGQTYAVDSDVRPTRTGKCAVAPLSPASMRYLLVQAQPPYKQADGTFNVGTGSETFRTDDGGNASVTCNSSHPCTLVLKLQYPDAFGFQPIPLTFR